MSRKVEWTEILETEILSSANCDLRPFVCEGFPHDCDIIVIGQNPATHLNRDWREFWNETSGFNYTSFTEAYEEHRRKQGKARKSRTRTRFDRFWDNGFKCVETNVCSEVGVEKSDKECYCNAGFLRVLLDNMPRQHRIGVFAHGVPATNFIDNYQCPDNWHVHKTCHLHLQRKEIRFKEIDRFCEELKNS